MSCDTCRRNMASEYGQNWDIYFQKGVLGDVVMFKTLLFLFQHLLHNDAVLLGSTENMSYMYVR